MVTGQIYVFNIKSVLIFAFFLVGIINNQSKVNAQPWMEAGMEADGRLNFFKVQRAFNEYWKERPIEKGSGYKPYKRWEYYWQSRVDEAGYFPPAGLAKQEWDRYLAKVNTTGNRFVSNWTNIGPISTTTGYGGIGRTSAITFDPTNSNIIWVGTPGGGLWKSIDNGLTWTTNTDTQLAHLGVSDILIDPTNTNIMYIATGDADAGDTQSIGVLKSTNGGVSWQTTGLNWTASQTRRIYRLIMDPNDVNVLLAATNIGLYRSLNGGTTWTVELANSVRDVIANPDINQNIFYACNSTTIFRSTDNGDNFTSVITLTGTNRIALAVTPANTNYVYAVSSKSAGSGFNAVHRSTNAGVSFTQQSTSPNILSGAQDGSGANGQGWYDLCITADPLDAEIVYVGGINTWKSQNGGATWVINTFWYDVSGLPTVHADKHLFKWQNTNTLWSGNDGGVYFTTNGGSTWTDRSSGLVNSQIYRLGVSQSDSKVIVGLQDNGTKLRSTAGIWSDHIGGDGMECLIHPTNPSIMYGEYQNGVLHRSTNGGASWTNIRNNISTTIQGSWITPFELDPITPTTIYAAYAHLYKSTNQGNSWTIIGNSSVIGTNNKTILEICKSNPNHIYVGTSDRISRTTNGGTTWAEIILPISISSLEVHPTKPNTIWVTASNYTAGAKVYKSINGGRTWQNISGTLPNFPYNTIVHNHDLPESVYVGGDLGVFYLNNDMSDWQPFISGLPNVEIFELEIDYTEDRIYAASYGRGLWYSDLQIPATVCMAPVDVVVRPSHLSLNIQWTVPTTAPSQGYQYAVTTSATPPASGTVTTVNDITVGSLAANTLYYIHVRSNCGSGQSVWKTIAERTAITCGSTFSDSGGSGGNYSNNEYRLTTICPSTSAQTVSMTFTSFSTESNYDGLYFYNGSIFDNMMPSTSGVLASGYPAGSYHGTNNPGTVSSSHSSGCLTALFRSDGSTVSSGWLTSAIVCNNTCSNIVTNANDSGPGSLRAALSCAASNPTITFENSLINQTINLMSPIVVSSSFTMAPNILLGLKISSTNGHSFEIQNGVTAQIENLTILSGNGTNTRAIINNGTLNLRNVIINDPSMSLGQGNTINNLGTLNILDTVTIKP